MARQRRVSNASGVSNSHELGGSSGSGGGGNGNDASLSVQELGSMYDYLAKIILIGPSGAGKSCVLHRFLRNEWRALSSQTIGVEFGSKIVALGTAERRTRIKLQLWDTAGTERFRAVSRSYYRGAAGALLVYDVASYASFAALPNFLTDARNLASPKLSVVLLGNKSDVDDPGMGTRGGHGYRDGLGSGGFGLGLSSSEDGASLRTASLASNPSAGSFTQADSDVWGGDGDGGDDDDDDWDRRTERAIDITQTPTRLSTSSNNSQGPPTPSSAGSVGSGSTMRYAALSGQQPATQAPHGRDVDAPTAARWASSQNVPLSLSASALSGDGVEDAFRRLAQIILTKIELGEVNPDDPQSGIQYGDAGWWDPSADDEGSVNGTSGGGGGLRRRKGKGGGGSRLGTASGLREWESVFRLDKGRGRRNGCC